MRLADRRGLLQGRDLSRVQERALEMLLIIENRERAKAFADDLRSRLVAHDPSRTKDIFP